jgi:hypothetical protein
MFAPCRVLCTLAVAAVLFAEVSMPARALPQWGHEVSIGTPFPVDSGVTYNGRRGVVRSGITTGLPSAAISGAITVWDLTSGSGSAAPTSTSLTALGETPDPYGFGNDWRPSDCVASANIYSVTTGSGSFAGTASSGEHDQTYIESLKDINTSTPIIEQSHLIGRTGSTTPEWELAGHVNDVEISRDGVFAIVNDRNWIHRIELSNGNLTSINIGYDWGPLPGTPGATENLCTPNGAVDSVALVADRAVITTSRLEFGIIRVTWVYLVEIDPFQIILEQRVAPPTLPELDLGPHDVAVSLGGDFAVVTSNRMVSFFNLTNDTYLGVYYRPQLIRNYQIQVDSVEITDNYAVVLSDDNSGASLQWHIDVFDLASISAPPLGAVASYGGDLDDSLPNRAHDLAINKERTRVVVRTSFDNFVLPLTTPFPGSLTPLNSGVLSDAHLYITYSQLGPYEVFSSDSVVVQPEISGAQVAATIGGSLDSGTGRYVAHVDFIDFSTAPFAAIAESILAPGSGQSDFGALPLDLELTRDRREVVVRSAAPYVDATPNAASVGGGDVVFFDLSTRLLVQAHGGSGYATALDCVNVGTTGGAAPRKRVLSVSEDPINNVGLVHIVDRP